MSVNVYTPEINQLNEIRPRLRLDAIFIGVDNGVFFQCGEDKFLMRGATVYQWISKLAPYLNGNYTLAQLCDGLGPEHTQVVSQLIETLIKRNIIKNAKPESEDILSDAIKKKFQPQIRLIEHYADSPLKKFDTFRSGSVLLLGTGEAYRTTAVSLLRNGLETIYVTKEIDTQSVAESGIDEEDYQIQHIDWPTQATDLEEYNLIVYVAEQGSPRIVHQLQQLAREANRPFLPALSFKDAITIGPLASGEASDDPCWICAQLRFGANSDSETLNLLWKEIAFGSKLASAAQSTGWRTIARRLGEGVTFEIFKILTGFLKPETAGSIIVQDEKTLETRRAKLIAHPLCPTCSASTPKDSEAYLQKVVSESTTQCTEEVTLDDFYQSLDPEFGVFKQFNDEAVVQMPLKVAKIEFGTQDGESRQVVSFHIDTLQQSRDLALYEAIRQYSQALFDPEQSLRESYSSLQASGKTAVPPSSLATWTGSPVFVSDRPVDWFPAYSLFDEEIHYVPTTAVYAQSNCYSLGIFERFAPGASVGHDFQQTIEKGALNTLGYEALRGVMSGEHELKIIAQDSLLEIDTDLDFLLESIKNFDMKITIGYVDHAMPHYTVVAWYETAQGEAIYSGGTAFSFVSAIHEALAQIVGHMQVEDSEQVVRFHPNFVLSPDLVLSKTAVSPADCPSHDWATLIEFLKQEQRKLYFAATTPIDIQRETNLITGTILVTA